METIKIRLHGTTDKRRVLYAAPNSPTQPCPTLRLIVSTPSVLPKDNDYRQGAVLCHIDLSPLRFFGHVSKALQELRPIEWGWHIQASR